MDYYNTTQSVQSLDNFIPTIWSSNPKTVTVSGMLIIIFLYELWFRNTYAYKTLRNMPGPFVYPLIGNAHLIFGLTNSEIMRKALVYLQRYGETVRGVLGNKCIVFLTNPSDIELILNSQVHLEKSEEYRFFKPWFGDGLLISKGDHWRLHRKMIAPTFHQSILKSFVGRFVQHSQLVAERLDQLVGSSEFDIHDHMSQASVEILLSTVMGVHQLPPGKRCFDYAKAVMDMCHIIHRRQIELFSRLDVFYKWTKMRVRSDITLSKILSLTQDVISDRKRNFNIITDSVMDQGLEDQKQTKVESELRDDLDDLDENDVGEKRRLALLDAMVELTRNPEVKWSEKDVIDEVNTIMFEGHDTTAAGASFVLCLLGIHQEIQAKVYAEQKQIFGRQMQRNCTFSDTLEMNYLERVIKETLRLYPPVPIIARKVNEDVPLVSGPYVIPRGCTVVLGQYAAHRRPDIYQRPDVFNPDNFLPESVSKRHYYSYVPFSAGPRSCVGRKYAMLMLKVLLSTLLRRFEVHCKMREQDFVLQADIILKLENGFNISLSRRKEN